VTVEELEAAGIAPGTSAPSGETSGEAAPLYLVEIDPS
jgi:hypothetical protein